MRKSIVGAYSDMATKEESDETKTEDDYIPGKSLNLVSTSNLVLLGMLIISFWVGFLCNSCPLDVGCRVLGGVFDATTC
jgi:hypothetical protein